MTSVYALSIDGRMQTWRRIASMLKKMQIPIYTQGVPESRDKCMHSERLRRNARGDFDNHGDKKKNGCSHTHTHISSLMRKRQMNSLVRSASNHLEMFFSPLFSLSSLSLLSTPCVLFSHTLADTHYLISRPATTSYLNATPFVFFPPSLL